ncbi:MAG: hypothetical protein JWN44_5620 [Myxococcales bacterium]|nr:hypothetical protein [Myxococcales bacterium]
MLLRKLITVAGLAGTLGAASPALADWYQPPPPVYREPVYEQPVYQPYGRPAEVDPYYANNGWRREHHGRRDEWRRREEWQRGREDWERHRWRRMQWYRWHGDGPRW